MSRSHRGTACHPRDFEAALAGGHGTGESAFSCRRVRIPAVRREWPAIDGNKWPLATGLRSWMAACGDSLPVPDSPRMRAVESCSATWLIRQITSRMAKRFGRQPNRTRSSVRVSLVVHEPLPGAIPDNGHFGRRHQISQSIRAGDGLFSTIGRQYKETAELSEWTARASRDPITLDRVGNVTWRRRMARSLADQSWRGWRIPAT